jgi:hypothetical protein
VALDESEGRLMGVSYLICGAAGTILKRTGAGAYEAKTSGTAANLNFISGIAHGPIYAGGVETLIRSDDDGETWSTVAGISWGAGEVVRQIHVRAANRVYVATSAQLLLWNGSAWSQLKTGNGHGCWSFADNDVWFVVAVAGDDIAYQYNGSTWTDRGLGTTGTQAGRCYGAAANALYISGPGGSGGTLVAKWDGSAFSLAYSTTQTSVEAVHGSAANDVLAVEVTPAGGYFRANRYNGTAWSLEYTSVIGGQAPAWAHTIAAGESLAVCASGVVFSRSAGTWSRELSGSAQNLTGVWSPGDVDGPYAINETPGPGDRDHPPDGELSFTLTDDLGTVTLASIRISVNGTQIYDGATWASGWTASTVQSASGNAVIALRHSAPFTRRVNHPGTKPLRYLDAEAARAEPALLAAVERSTQAAADSSGF